ncbi:hypothetical protein MtrunA17_Chr7g0220441 [Medicago truncatula]|uniref:Uncharacterized protein n=1 Tax=Medicago truncatula TaxID=3880 RepID=A0A396GYJ5_MEDTR|nr:hypothetical protein MtrunA17_Chr7g0220441 [Medicago truncatula]
MIVSIKIIKDFDFYVFLSILPVFLLNSKPYPSDSFKGRDVWCRNYFCRGSVHWSEW